jgi:hypothetical protein
LAICHRGIPHGREGLETVPPTLGAVASIVGPRMIATMPLSPPSVIFVIIVVVLALSGRIVVGGGTRVGPGAVPGSWKCSVRKGKEQGKAKWGGGGTNGSRGIA